jgi:hypothetical protein
MLPREVGAVPYLRQQLLLSRRVRLSPQGTSVGCVALNRPDVLPSVTRYER